MTDRHLYTTNKVNVQCKLCNMKLVHHRATRLKMNYLHIRHKEKTVETDAVNKLAVLACSVVMPRRQRLAITEISTVNTFSFIFV